MILSFDISSRYNETAKNINKDKGKKKKKKILRQMYETTIA
jgi:hypothetical protein